MMTAVALEFPAFETIARQLVAQHLRDPEDKLLLAVYYAPSREPQDIFIFEAFENFGSKSIGEERNFFEISFGSTQALPLEPDQYLHLVLTNPDELKIAARENWALFDELRCAIRNDQHLVLYQNAGATDLWKLIHG